MRHIEYKTKHVLKPREYLLGSNNAIEINYVKNKHLVNYFVWITEF